MKELAGPWPRKWLLVIAKTSGAVSAAARTRAATASTSSAP
jgi:hypothetical protein